MTVQLAIAGLESMRHLTALLSVASLLERSCVNSSACCGGLEENEASDRSAY
jgi:hypothetical protein